MSTESTQAVQSAQSVKSEPPRRSHRLASRMREGWNNLVTRLYLGRLSGSHNGKRDYYEALGYPTEIDLKDLLLMFHRGGIAHRVVKSLPENVWSYPPTIYSSSSKAFEKEFEDFAKRTNLWSVLMRLDMMMRLGRYAVLLIGAGSSKMDQPLERKDSQKILYLQPYADVSISISRWDENPLSERFGQPVIYQITPGDVLVNPKSADNSERRGTIDVHFSRIVHVAFNTLESEIYGTPVLYPIYNHLLDLIKVVGGSSEAHWLVANRGLQIDIDKDMDLDPEDEAALTQEIEEYEHRLRRIIRTRGVTVNPLGSDPTSPKDNFEVILSCISGTTGIPKRILTGAEAGQMASSQDKAAWAERITEYQNSCSWPIILFPVIMKLIEIGALPSQKPENIFCDWTESYQMNPLERSQTAAQTSRAVSNLARAMRDQPGLLGATEARRIIGASSKEMIYEFGPEVLPSGEEILDPPEVPGAVGKQTPNGESDPAGASAVDPTRETKNGNEQE